MRRDDGAETRAKRRGATGAGVWRDAVGQGHARERLELELSRGPGGSIPVLGTARIDRPDAAVVSVVVVAVRGFALRTRFRDRQWRADSRGDEEDARVAHAPRRVLIVAVTLSHVELPLACRAGATGRAEAGRVESFISFLRAKNGNRLSAPTSKRRFRSRLSRESYPFDFPIARCGGGWRRCAACPARAEISPTPTALRRAT